MKKMLIMIIVIFSISVKNIKAETIYGEYYQVDVLKTQKEDEIKIDSYKIYNTYKIEYEDLGYIEENDLYIKDDNDFIYEEKTPDNYNDGDEYIITNLSHLNKEKLGFKMGNIGYDLKIYELEIYHKGEKVDYIIGNQSEFDKYNLNIINISDNNLETYYSHQISHLYIYIKFLEKYNIEDVEIVIYTKESNDNSFLFYYDDRPKVILHNNIARKHTISFNLTEENIGLVEYFYKENIKLYKYYKKNYIKKDIYVKEGNNLILDDYKIINEYYERDKLILDDDLIIDSKEKNIDNLIKYSTDEVNALCDINYNVNGIYKCNFILNDINIERNILVDIKENEKAESIIEESNKIEDEEDKIFNRQYIKELENFNREDINKHEDIVIKENIENDNVINEDNSIKESVIEDRVENTDKEIHIETDNIKVAENNVFKQNITKNIKNEKNNDVLCIQGINKSSLNEEIMDKEKNNPTSENLNLVNRGYFSIYNKNNRNNLKIVVIIVLILLIFIRIFILIKIKRNNVESL